MFQIIGEGVGDCSLAALGVMSLGLVGKLTILVHTD